MLFLVVSAYLLFSRIEASVLSWSRFGVSLQLAFAPAPANFFLRPSQGTCEILWKPSPGVDAHRAGFVHYRFRPFEGAAKPFVIGNFSSSGIHEITENFLGNF